MVAGQKKGDLLTHCKRGHVFSEDNTIYRKRNRGRGEEIHRICKTCHREKSLSHYYLHREENKERNNARARQWRKDNKDYVKSKKLFNDFGITLEEYMKIISFQNNKCKICELEWDIAKGYFPVDHDHATGKVRGILCPPCNRALGWYEKRSKQIKSYLNE